MADIGDIGQFAHLLGLKFFAFTIPWASFRLHERKERGLVVRLDERKIWRLRK